LQESVSPQPAVTTAGWALRYLSDQGVLDLGQFLLGDLEARETSVSHTAYSILIGGQLLCGRPDLAAMVGADATATDGAHAVVQAEQLRAHMAAAPG
jgi:hypothetical protein